MGPAVRHGVGRNDRAQGDGSRRRPPRSGAGAGGGRQRAGGARAVRLVDEPGRRRPHPAHRAGLHPAGRPRLPAPRADLRGAARGGDDTARGDRRGVRAQPAQLRPAMRLLRAASRPHLGRRSQGVDGHLGAGDGNRHAVGRAPRPRAMFEFATRQAAVGTGATPIEREIVTCETGAGQIERAVERGDRAGRAPSSGGASSRTPGRKRWRGPSCSRRFPPPTTS